MVVRVDARAARPDPTARAARGVRSTTASAPGGRGWFGPVGAIRRPGSSGCGYGGPPRHMWARGGSRPVFTPPFSRAFLLLSPNRIVPAAPSPRRSPRRPPPAATWRGAGQIGVPVIQADGRSAHGAKDALRRSPGRSSHCPPNRHPMRARSPVVNLSVPRSRVGRPPLPPAFTSLSSGPDRSQPETGGRSPRRPPAQLRSATTKTGER